MSTAWNLPPGCSLSDPSAPWNEPEPCVVCEREREDGREFCEDHTEADACVDCREALATEDGRCARCAECHAGTE